MNTDNEQLNPLLDSLDSAMRCAILTNPKGEVTILHDQSLSGDIEWIEYDEVEDTFSLIYEQGRIQPLGLSIEAKMKENLIKAQSVTLLHIKDKQAMSSQDVSFICT